MNRPGPAPERGGTPAALANIRKGGLKKARNTSVIADMTTPEAGDQRDRLHSVPALVETAVPEPAPEPAQQPAPAAPVQQPVAPVQLAPAVAAPPVQEVSLPPVQPVAPTVQEQATAEPEEPEKKKYRKTSFFQTKESGSRMRSAYVATRHLTRVKTLSEFILAAVEREVEALEKQYNNGDPFDADPDSVPRGRPLEG